MAVDIRIEKLTDKNRLERRFWAYFFTIYASVGKKRRQTVFTFNYSVLSVASEIRQQRTAQV
ncbi:hypothetical protein DAPPUDRAFT_312861 [Daphnia pulex]|uniref:Uncharacterized protein n=1 Tax=Daphnia pulex TaxID=6669 RepID=E9G1U0_DAPPU|nr:hypothetical protein DAPPUDRAFT_312861 [Daphnia pulex]|eukprot:EFX86754.1 hypothetical protein DAPPUDRAFT_312861 [Daphnia pulex]